MIHQADIAPATGLALEIDATEFRRAVDYLARNIAASGRHCCPTLCAISIETASDGAAVLSACDLDMEAAISLPAAVQAPGALTIDASTLRAVLKAAKRGDALSIAETRDGRAMIAQGRAVQTLPTLSGRDVPAMRPACGATVAIAADTLRADLERIGTVAADGERRDGALLIQARSGFVDVVATDGHNLSVATRAYPGCDEWQAALSKRGLDTIARALKLWPCGEVSVRYSPDMITIEGERFAISARAIDNPNWADWRPIVAARLGEELQQTLDPISEPRLCQAALKQFEKASGELHVEIGRNAARLTIPGDESWQGITMLQPEGAVPRGYSYNSYFTAQAKDYLQEFMTRHGIEPAPGEAKLVEHNGRVLGMTMGTYRHSRKVRLETVLDWENLVEREVEIVEHEEGWQPGAFSVVMPRVREAVCAEITVDVDGELIPLARHTNGSLYMTAKQVAAWCGPIDEAARVAIPEQPLRRAWWKHAAPLGAPKEPSGRDALMMTGEQMAAYANACADAAEAHNGRVEPAEAPEASAEPVQAAPSVPDAVEPVQAPEPLPSAPESASELAELRSMLAAVSARLAVLERGKPAAEPVAPSDAPASLPRDDRARAVINARDDIQAARAGRDDAARLRAVRAYLQLRQVRAQLSQVRAELALVKAERAAEAQRADSLAAELQSTRQALSDGRQAMRRAIDTEEALLGARSRGDRLARIALGQRNRLERAAVDLRGARAEAGALRRRLVQASATVSREDSEPRGTMAVAFARAQA